MATGVGTSVGRALRRLGKVVRDTVVGVRDTVRSLLSHSQ